MPDVVIQVANLGKKFRRGVRPSYSRFSELLTGTAHAGARWVRDRALSLVSRGNGHEASLDDNEFWALKDVSFEVKRGEVLGIIGRNGAGKSTLLKLLSRITKPTTGEIRLRGRVGSLLEVGTGFHPELTGRENIYLNGTVLGMRKREVDRRFDEIVDFAEIEQFLDTPVKHYSSGMYMRLAFAVAGHLEPEILVVDEVLAVGDAEFQKKCLGKMSEVAKGGRTVLFVSHNLAAIHAMCHSVLLLTRGRVACAGGADESIAHYVRMSAGMSTTRLADRTDRTGSGAVRFTAVEVLAGSNERANVVPNNAPFTLRLRYQNTLGRDLRFVLVAVGIDDEHGVRVTQLNSDVCGCSLKTVPAAAEAFDIHVKRLPLAAGRYGLTLWCSVNGEIADWLTAEVECLHVFDGGFFRRGRQPLAGQGRLLVEHRFSCCASRS